MKINRKKFFASIGAGIAGIFLFKSSAAGKAFAQISKKKLTANPNPLAVKREKSRVNNG